MDRPTEGLIKFGNTELSKLDESSLANFRSKEIGFVFQFSNLLPDFSAIENVIIPQLISGKSKLESRKRAEELMGFLGLSSIFNRRPGALSGGERQSCLLYTSPSPRDATLSRMPSSA